MGPRPPSVQWLPAKKGSGKGKGQSADVRPPQGQNRVAPPRSRRWRGRTETPNQDRVNPEVRARNPSNVETDWAEQIGKLEQAIEILGRDSKKSAGLISQLKRLQAASNDSRHAAAEEAAKKAVELQSKFEAEFQEGLERLKQLREEAAAHTSSMRVDPPDEVSALRSRISELEEEAQTRVRGAPQEESRLPLSTLKSTSCGSRCRICRESGIF